MLHYILSTSLKEVSVAQQQESRRRSGSKRHGPEFMRTGSNNAFRREPLINPGNLHEMRAKVVLLLCISLDLKPSLKSGSILRDSISSFGASTSFQSIRRKKMGLFLSRRIWHQIVFGSKS